VLPDPGDGLLLSVRDLGERGGEWGLKPHLPQSNYRVSTPTALFPPPGAHWGWPKFRIESKLPSLAPVPLLARWVLDDPPLRSPSLGTE
jgi:hypothetical protein